jgi:hypothetical protein
MSREVHSIPTSDLAFHEYALAALDCTEGLPQLEEVAAALTQLLRPIYPAIEVRRQDVYARIRDVDVWYAYRDGCSRPMDTLSENPPE